MGQRQITCAKIFNWLETNIDLFYELGKEDFKASLTQEQITRIKMQKKYSANTLEDFVKREFHRYMFEKADQFISNRRRKMRNKKISKIRGILSADSDYFTKDLLINQ